MVRETRSKLGLMLLLCFTLMLAACSNGDPSSNNSQGSVVTKTNQGEASTQSMSFNQAKEDDTMRKISTVMGEINVPAHPERVVVDWDLGAVLAVGVTPVGASSTQMKYAEFLKPYLSDTVQDIGPDGGISMEKVLNLSPDVIITWNKDAYENYSKIAPTIVFDASQYASIREEITAMGKILDRQDEAQHWLADYEKRSEAAREKIKNVIPKGATFSIVDYVTVDKYLMVIGNMGERGGMAAYQILGLNPAPKVASEIIDKKLSRVELSWETVGDYVGDYVIVLTSESKEPPKLPVAWTSLNAVKKNRVIKIEMNKYFAADPFSALLQAEDIADKITKQAAISK